MIYSTCKVSKQGDSIQPWRTPFPIWNQSFVPCLVLAVASWPAYRFFRMQVRWSGIPISFRIFQFVVTSTVIGFSIVNGAEVGVFLEFPCFFYDPVDIGSLISASSALSKSSLYIWDFLVHVLLKPCLENFEHYFAGMWNECSCVAVWTFFGIGIKTDLFQSCGHCWIFQICWHTEWSTFTVPTFRIWNSWNSITSTSFFVWYFLRPVWLHTPGCLTLGEWSHHPGYLSH